MIIRVTVSGGWAGLRSTCVIDTCSLPAPDARRIEIAVLVCVAVPMPPPPARVRDGRTYRIEAEQGGELQIVSFNEAIAPPEAVTMLRVMRPVCPDIA